MATFTVINTNDSGRGSLRQAIEDANFIAGLDTIKFDENLSGQKITLTIGELEITDDLTINGLGANLLTVSGNNLSRVFLIDDGDRGNQTDVIIDGLTITEGTTTDNGGGILNRENLTVLNSDISDNAGTGISSMRGNLTVDNSTISDNTSSGISSVEGYLTVLNSTISDNMGLGIVGRDGNWEITTSTISHNRSGGMSLGWTNFILTNSTISNNTGSGIRGDRVNFEIDNSTISGNTTIDDGGGISGGSYHFSGTITNSTITNNTADSDGDGVGNGGGVNKYIGGGGMIFKNTIIAGNFDNSPADSERHPDISGPGLGSHGYNLIGDITGIRGFNVSTPPPNPFTALGDLFGTSENPLDPLLGPLQDNGGSTQTHALLTGSPAIDAGDPDFESPPEFDQRGAVFPRLLDGNGDGAATVDIGAFEFANIIDGTSGNDLLFGTTDSDRINGFGGNDTLRGGAGADILLGQAGDDSLVGGLGLDSLTGGAGNDKFNLVSGLTADSDIIQDYQDGLDRLVLTGGLTFGNLNINQNGADTEIIEIATNETLVTLIGIDTIAIDNSDFI